jgi:hypothetical protein
MHEAGLRLENPYLEEFEATAPHWPAAPELRKLTMERYVLRQALVAKYAWAVPSDAAIELLLRYSPLVEMGAGTGYWAGLIRSAGGDVVAYDRYPPPDPRNRWHAGQPTWSQVRPGGVKRLRLHPDRTLFLCWPPDDEPMGIESLTAYPGLTVVFAGETGAGSDLARELDRWELVESLDIPQWEGIRDRLFVLRRPST